MYEKFPAGDPNATCPLCEAKAFAQNYRGLFARFLICKTCGAYVLTEQAFLDIRSGRGDTAENRYKIRSTFRIASDELSDFSSLPMHMAEDIARIEATRDPSISEKLDNLILWLAKVSKHPGSSAVFDYEHDYTLFCATGSQEALFLIESLEAKDLLTTNGDFTSPGMEFKLTAAGWSAVSALQQTKIESSNGFIAMWFDSSRSDVDAAITRAIENAGYTAIRIDRIEHLNRIDDEIIARIRSSKFLIADFTGQRNGVYFEAGFMLGLGRPVVWLCQKDELSKVHFDTRQYNTIDYSDPAELEKRLQNRIEAILGKGPLPSASA